MIIIIVRVSLPAREQSQKDRVRGTNRVRNVSYVGTESELEQSQMSELVRRRYSVKTLRKSQKYGRTQMENGVIPESRLLAGDYGQ